MSQIQVNLLHILAIGPLLIYIGSNKKKTNKLAYTALGVLALMIPFIVNFPSSKFGEYNLILLGHWLFFDIFFLYVAYSGLFMDVPNFLYLIILYLGLSVIAIHLYYLYKNIKLNF
jgi:hypothetical protein